MKKTIYRPLLLLLLIVYYAGTYISDTITGGKVILYASIGLMFLTYLMAAKGKIRMKHMGFILYVGLFLMFCFGSYVWAENPQLSVSKINRLLVIFASMFIIDQSVKKKLSVDDLLRTIMIGSYVVIIYSFFRFGIRGILALAVSSERIDNELLNANTLGMCAAYAIMINVYYILKRKYRLTDLFIVPAFIILGVSQSRKALLIAALGVAGIYILSNFEKKNAKKILARLLLSVIILFIVLLAVSRMEFMEPILLRIVDIFKMLQGEGTRTTNSAWLRFAYMKLGFDIFKKNPIVGIGIGNAVIYTQQMYGHDHYLHSNIFEMLACGGLVGFIIYYSIYVSLLHCYMKKKKYIEDKECALCFVLLCVNLIVDVGVVSYYNPARYFMLYIIWKKIKEVQQSKKFARINKGVEISECLKENFG